eukprot:878042-Amorphochlora_amoeboformis.AAC.2
MVVRRLHQHAPEFFECASLISGGHEVWMDLNGFGWIRVDFDGLDEGMNDGVLRMYLRMYLQIGNG